MMTEKELIKHDAQRDLGAKLLEPVKQMKAGKKSATPPVQVSTVGEARHKIELPQGNCLH